MRGLTRELVKYVSIIVLGLILVLLSVSASCFIYQYVEKNIRQDLLSSLKTVNGTTEKTLSLWVDEEKSVIKSWSLSNDTLISYVESLLDITPNKSELITHPAMSKLRSHVEPLIRSKGYMGFFVISPEWKNIASMRDGNLGHKNLLKNSEGLLERAFKGETVISLPQFSDISLHNGKGALVSHLPSMFIVTPIYNKQDNVIALLAFRIDPRHNFSHLLQLGRIGDTGETYAFNKQAKLLSESRFHHELVEMGFIQPEQTEILNVSILDPGVSLRDTNTLDSNFIPTNLPMTLMAEKATKGINGYNLDGYRDYRGVEVVGIWRWNKELRLGITTEIDVGEAFYTLNIIRLATVGSIGINVVLMFVLFMGLIRHLISAERQSLEDSLTGLFNRRLLDNRLEIELAHSLRSQKELAVCMIDVDGFKKFNDHYGHVAGDDALRVIADTIKAALKRRTDFVARYGGEEFCVVLPDTPTQGARHVAESIRLAVEHEKISRNNADENSWVTISIGVVSQVFDEALEVHQVFALADEALYKAKNSGRNCVMVYGKK